MYHVHRTSLVKGPRTPLTRVLLYPISISTSTTFPFRDIGMVNRPWGRRRLVPFECLDPFTIHVWVIHLEMAMLPKYETAACESPWLWLVEQRSGQILSWVSRFARPLFSGPLLTAVTLCFILRSPDPLVNLLSARLLHQILHGVLPGFHWHVGCHKSYSILEGPGLVTGYPFGGLKGQECDVMLDAYGDRWSQFASQDAAILNMWLGYIGQSRGGGIPAQIRFPEGVCSWNWGFATLPLWPCCNPLNPEGVTSPQPVVRHLSGKVPAQWPTATKASRLLPWYTQSYAQRH